MTKRNKTNKYKLPLHQKLNMTAEDIFYIYDITMPSLKKAFVKAAQKGADAFNADPVISRFKKCRVVDVFRNVVRAEVRALDAESLALDEVEITKLIHELEQSDVWVERLI